MPLPRLVRFVSVAFVVAALSAAGLAWFALDTVQITVSLVPGMSTASEPSRRLLTVADDTLTEVRATLDVVGSVTDDIGTSADETADVLEGIEGLLSERIPEALTAIEASMPALIDTAAVIDDTMGTLAIIGVPYNPDVPFDTALREVETQLEGLPEVVAEQGSSLAAIVPVVRTSGQDVARLSDHLVAIDEDLAAAQLTLEDYEQAIVDLEQIALVGDDVARFIPFARVGTVIMALAGIALGLGGWSLAGRLAHPAPMPVVERLPD